MSGPPTHEQPGPNRAHARPTAGALRSLARGSATYAVGHLLARVGGFLLLPVYLQLMTSSDYGLVALSTSIVGFLNIVYRLGLDGALMRLHFDAEGRDPGALSRTLLLATFAFAAGCSLILALAVGPIFSQIFPGVTFVPFGALAIGIALVNASDYVPLVMYRARQQPGAFLVFTLTSFAITSILSVGLVAAGHGAVGALAGQFVGGGIMAAAATVITIREPGARWLPESLRPALSFGLPLVPHQISTWTMRLSDRWLLGLLLVAPTSQRLEAIGAYSVGYQLGSVVFMLASSFNSAWMPYFYRVGETVHGSVIFRHVLTITTAGFAWVALGLGALAPEVIEVIASPSYGVASQVLPIVALASVCQALYTMLVGVIFLRRRTALLPVLTAVSAAANIGLNLLLIPRFGVMGAAWTTLVAYALFAFLTWLYARRVYPVSVDIGRIGAVAGITVGAIALSRQLDLPNELVRSAAQHVLVVGVSTAMLWMLVRAPIAELRRAAREASRSVPPDSLSPRPDTTPSSRRDR